jgi:hypothetical protein
VVLVVDHKIPVDWGGSNEEDNLWAICEDCNSEVRHARAGREPAAYIFLNRSAKERLGALLIARAGEWLPSCLLREVAGASDWARCVRSLRAEGYALQIRRQRRRETGPITYYCLPPPPS